MADNPPIKHMLLTDAQVKKALLALFKEDIRKLYDVDTFAMVSGGRFVAKLKLRTK